MVIGGKIRGNAPQLADYLLAIGENERVTIFDVDGRSDADAHSLKELLYSMELNSELTRSRNSVYHAYINPNPEDTTDRVMTMEEWQQSVDILTKQLGYEDQRRVVVLHEKPGNRIHAHIVYERYHHESGVMATYEYNYKAHDAARAEMEAKLNHKPTPQKNKNRDQHKQTLTEIWRRTKTADDFIKEAEASGYKIAKGTDRPFRVIDAEGVSFDLVRKLDGIKTKEVRERFEGRELMPEKEAIREQQSAKQERQKVKEEPAQQPIPQPEALPEAPQPLSPDLPRIATPAEEISNEREELRRKFLEQAKDIRERNRSYLREITLSVIIALRVCFSFKGNASEQGAMQKQKFVSCAQEITVRQEQRPPPKALGFIEAAQFYKPTYD